MLGKGIFFWPLGFTIMITKKHFVEQRRMKRFKVKEGAFVEFHKPRLFKLGKSRIIESAPIIDISLKGLAFQYTDRNMWTPNFNALSISRIADEVKIDKVPYKAVSDFPISNVANSIFLRRCSVKFLGLAPTQKSQLNHFIQNHTIGNRRSGSERRQFSCADHSPERRSDKDRRGHSTKWYSYVAGLLKTRFSSF